MRSTVVAGHKNVGQVSDDCPDEANPDACLHVVLYTENLFIKVKNGKLCEEYRRPCQNVLGKHSLSHTLVRREDKLVGVLTLK